jgi:tRNA(adenine34) deaminase
MTAGQNEYFMGLALIQARAALKAGEFPVGCIIVAAGRVVGEGRRTHSQGAANELDHAEVVALRELLTRAPEIEPAGLTVYSTMEPCLMCYATLLLNGVRRIVYAYEDVMGGAAGLNLATLAPLYREMRVRVDSGVRRAESLALFKEFFANQANGYWQGSLLAEYTLTQA